MNHDDPLAPLFAKARDAGPHDTASQQFGFETRLSARLRQREKTSELLVLWPWRLLPVFAVLTLMLTWGFWQQQETNLDLQSAVEEYSEEWAYVEALSGRYL